MTGRHSLSFNQSESRTLDLSSIAVFMPVVDEASTALVVGAVFKAPCEASFRTAFFCNDDVQFYARHVSVSYNIELSKYAQNFRCAQSPFI